MLDKARSRHSLTATLPTWSVQASLTLRSLAEVGTDAFEAVLHAAAIGDPERASVESVVAMLDEFIAMAGDRFDENAWFVVEQDGEPVGVVLPQVFPDRPDRGTMFYVGVVPDQRGRGIGRALHAIGMQALADRGAAGYFGTVDPGNAAMIAVYRGNGCEVYVPRKRSEPDPGGI